MTAVEAPGRGQAWWVGLTALVVAVLVALTGWWMVVVYAVCNVAGTLVFVPSSSSRSTVLRALTALQVPVGIIAPILSRGSRPSDHMFETGRIGEHERRAGIFGPFQRQP